MALRLLPSTAREISGPVWLCVLALIGEAVGNNMNKCSVKGVKEMEFRIKGYEGKTYD